VIIDGPITFDLTMGADRRIPQDGDAQTQVPPIVNPVVLALKPTKFSNGGQSVISSSTLIDLSLVRNNQAAVNQPIHTLVPGLWELECSLTTQFDYAGAVGTLNGVAIMLRSVTGTQCRILQRLAAIGTFVDYNRLRLLLVENVILSLDVGITGVGDHQDSRASINAIRIL